MSDYVVNTYLQLFMKFAELPEQQLIGKYVFKLWQEITCLLAPTAPKLLVYDIS